MKGFYRVTDSMNREDDQFFSRKREALKAAKRFARDTGDTHEVRFEVPRSDVARARLVMLVLNDAAWCASSVVVATFAGARDR